MSNKASLLESFVGGLEASLSVLLTLTYGVIAARLGLIGPSAMKDVSKLCNEMFLPALLIVNVGGQLNVNDLDKYWPVLVWSIFYILLSCLLGWLSVRIFKLPPWVPLASGFNNTTSLPLLLVQALASTNILQGLVTNGESVEDAVRRAKSYFLICSVVKNVLVIGLGQRLLNESKAEDGESTGNALGQEHQDGEQRHSEDVEQQTETSSLLATGAARRLYTAAHKVHNAVDSEYERLPPKLQSTVSILGALVNPASIGAVIAAIIGLTPPLHRLFFGHASPVKPWLTTSIQNVGELFTALQMFVVGGMLNESLQHKGHQDGMSKAGLGVAFFIRFILWSCVGIPIIYLLASRTNILSDDPILWFTMMLMAIGPPAMILSTTLEVAGADEKDQISVAKVLTFFYAITPLICFPVVAALKVAEAAKEARGL